MELHKIIEIIKPDIIFEELSDDVFNQCYGEKKRITLETTSIKEYLKINNIKHIPVATYEIPISDHDSFDKMFQKITGNNEFRLLLDKLIEYGYIYGFSYLNNKHCDILHEIIKEHKKKIIDYFDDKYLSKIYSLWVDYNEKKENIMINNIYNYSKKYQYDNAILFIGAAHRKSIIMKINKLKRKLEPKLNWGFFDFKKYCEANGI